MKKYITDYIKELEGKINNKNISNNDLEILKEKIIYFQHERLIHLLVTLTFALFTIIFLVLGMLSYIFLIPFFTLIIFLIFYIVHYFYLENSVQYLYKLEDKIKCKE